MVLVLRKLRSDIERENLNSIIHPQSAVLPICAFENFHIVGKPQKLFLRPPIYPYFSSHLHPGETCLQLPCKYEEDAKVVAVQCP